MSEFLNKVQNVAKVGLLLLLLNGCSPVTQANTSQIVENLSPEDAANLISTNPCNTPLLGKNIRINGQIISTSQGNIYGFRTDTQPSKQLILRDRRKKPNQIALLLSTRVSAAGKFVVADKQCVFDADEADTSISPAIPGFGP